MKTFINENGEKEYVIHSMTAKEMLKDVNETKSYLCEELYESAIGNSIHDESYQEYPDMELDEFDDQCAQIYINCRTEELDYSDDYNNRSKCEEAARNIHPMLKFATI